MCCDNARAAFERAATKAESPGLDQQDKNT